MLTEAKDIMQFNLRKMATAALLLGSALLFVGLTPGCSSAPGVHNKHRVGSAAISRVEWLPDGSALLFSRGIQGTFMVDVAGTRMRKIPSTTWNKNVMIGTKDRYGFMSAALSPDGSGVAYVAHTGKPGNHSEIRTADFEGSDSNKISLNDRYNVCPAWSPNGSQIAFLRNWQLTVVDADGSNQRTIEQTQSSYPPVWSPEGSWIATIRSLQTQGEISEYISYYYVLTLVRPDGSGLTTLEAVGGVSYENQKEPAVTKTTSGLTVLGALASMPAWSPDGSQIAFFQVEEGSVVLYTLELAAALERRQGEARKVLSIDGESLPNSVGVTKLLYETLSWSPDGTALLFVSDSEHIQGHVVSVVDGNVIADVGPGWAAWSPDGTRIAVVTSIEVHYTKSRTKADPDLRDVLYTMAQDGTDKRVLVRGNLFRFVAAGVE